MLFWKKQKAKCILPLEDVEIRAWPEQNFLLGLLLVQKTGWEWFMNQFVQLRGAHYVQHQYGAKDMSITFYPYAIHQLSPNLFDFCPFINKYTVPKSLIIGNYRDFCEFVKYSLENGYYLSTFLDQFFREDMHGNYGFHHPNFIYGYDDGEQCIYLADNFENGKYGRKKISYEQLNHAFLGVPGDQWEVSVFLYKLIPYQHTFYAPYVKEQIEDYLYPRKGICYFDRTVCQNPHYNRKDYENEVFFGIDNYQLLLNYLDAICKKNVEYPEKDWRSFVMLCDHKMMMVKRYEFMTQCKCLEKNEKMYSALKDLEQDCRIAQNMFLKYTLTDNMEIIGRLMNRMKQIKEKDMRCMEQFERGIILE